MLKKLIVSAIAAGALAVPLAGAAGADPDPVTNKGTPGNVGAAPGQVVSSYTSTQPQKNTGNNITDIARSAGLNSIGDAINNFANGQQKK